MNGKIKFYNPNTGEGLIHSIDESVDYEFHIKDIVGENAPKAGDFASFNVEFKNEKPYAVNIKINGENQHIKVDLNKTSDTDIEIIKENESNEENVKTITEQNELKNEVAVIKEKINNDIENIANQKSSKCIRINRGRFIFLSILYSVVFPVMVLIPLLTFSGEVAVRFVDAVYFGNVPSLDFIDNAVLQVIVFLTCLGLLVFFNVKQIIYMIYRLHDINKSGWFVLIYLASLAILSLNILVGTLLLLVIFIILFSVKGTEGNNNFGQPNTK